MSKWDKIITIIIFCVCVISLLLINVFAYSNGADNVIIELDGKEYARYRLKELSSPVTLEIDSEFGYNRVEITSDSIWVSESDCKDKLDVLAGKIEQAGEQIICLPHRLVIRIEKSRGDADAIAY